MRAQHEALPATMSGSRLVLILVLAALLVVVAVRVLSVS